MPDMSSCDERGEDTTTREELYERKDEWNKKGERRGAVGSLAEMREDVYRIRSPNLRRGRTCSAKEGPPKNRMWKVYGTRT